jgi:hypothetical protein
MIDSGLDPIIERIALEARRPVAVDSDAKARLMAAIRAEGAPGSHMDDSAALQRRQITLSTARFAAFAAGLVGIGVLVGSQLEFGRDSRRIGQPQVVVAGKGPSPRLPASLSADTVMTFVFVTHGATSVSLVGDFNQWNADATPMRRIENTNAWTVTVPLSAGRHLYSFFAVGADGEKFLADPTAPVSDDGFGHVNSVVLVTKGSAS